MSDSQETPSPPASVRIPESLTTKLYRDAQAEKFGLSPPAYAAVLEEVAVKYLPTDANHSELLEFINGLRHQELALARACALGIESAWETFLTRYREKLYTAAYTVV